MILNTIFSKLIKTPLVDQNFRDTFTKEFNNSTSEFERLKICKMIEFGYCTDEFLKEVFPTNLNN